MNWHAVSDYLSALRARWWRGWCIAVFGHDPMAERLACVNWRVDALSAQLRVRDLENALTATQDQFLQWSTIIDAALYRDGDADEPAECHEPSPKMREAARQYRRIFYGDADEPAA